GGPLFFLRPSPGQPPAEVLTRAGCLSGPHLPAAAAFDDHRTAQALESWGRQLLVAATPEDLAVLRALGFAAALARGLEAVDAGQLGPLCGCFGWTQRDSPAAVLCPAPGPPDVPAGRAGDAADEASPTAMVLLAWSPSTLALQKPAALDAAVARLRGIR